jgi:hypothetical protein
MRAHKLRGLAQKYGAGIADYLNKHRRTRDARALIALLAHVQQAADFQQQEASRIRSYFGTPGGLTAAQKTDKDSMGKRVSRRLRILDKEWKTIVGVPVLFGFDFSGDLRKMVFTYMTPWAKVPLTPLRSQAGALWFLAHEGLLHRVRRCLHCQRWLFAMKESQRCCSTRCRNAFHRSSPDYKLKHKLEMRRLREAAKKRRRPSLLELPIEERKARRNSAA